MAISRESRELYREGNVENTKRINCEHYLHSHTTEYWFNIQEMQCNYFRMTGGEEIHAWVCLGVM